MTLFVFFIETQSEKKTKYTMEETQHNPYIAYRTAPTALHFYRPNSNCNTLPIFSSTSPVYNTHLPFVTTSAESKGD
jgi:hypothetical protein